MPNELQRNFNLMRELDARAHNLLKGIDKEGNELLLKLTKNALPEEERRETLKQIQHAFNKV